ncbi:MAG TPA: c-type cytochrome [Gaiellaceae bacterium]|nr:c-type cytochrome [Gaiellaceae bacterium]
MRRSLLFLAGLALVAVVAACGAQGVVTPTPQTVVGKVPTTSEAIPTVPADKLTGVAAAGKQVFLKAGCTNCHTLAAAKSTGTVGPNLDAAKPSAKLVAARVTLGKNVMPSFKGQLSDQQIADVAAFVSSAAGSTP